MKQTKRWLQWIMVFCLVAVIIPVAVHADESNTCGSNLTWTLSDDGVLTISGTGSMEDYEHGDAPWHSNNDLIHTVVLEDGVTSVGTGAFYWCNNLTSVMIPDSVTSIGAWSFYSCSSLTNVSIGDNVTFIGDHVFHYCTGLTDVTIGNSVSTIGDYAFYYCTDLTDVTIGNSVSTIGDYAFCKCRRLTDVTVPVSVTTIGDHAFNGCESLTGIHVDQNNTSYFSDVHGVLYDKSRTSLIQAPGKLNGHYSVLGGITNIGDESFVDCTSLTGVTLPDSVSVVGNSAFYNCTNLKEIRFCGNEPSIGSNAFFGVTATVYYPPEDETWASGARGNYGGTITWKEYGSSEIARGTCGQHLTWILREDGVLTISGTGTMTGYDFQDEETPWYKYRNSIRTVVIESGITSIGHGAFQDCTNLTTVTIPASVTSVGHSSFEHCTALTSIVLPEDITYLGGDAFRACTSLTSLIIPGKVTKIYSYTFYGCSSLRSVIIPDSITHIGEESFFGCTSLTSVTIPSSVTVISDHVFIDCSSLTGIHVDQDNVYYSSDDCGVLFNKDKTELIQAPGGYEGHYSIPASVTNIVGYAFSGCAKLTRVDMPDSITCINQYTFYQCTGLTKVVIPEGVTRIGWQAFGGCTNLTSVIIPTSVTYLDSYAFFCCKSLTKVLIPDRITYINYRVFENCTSLNEIRFMGKAPSISSNSFLNVKATAYYPPDDTTWTSDKRVGYGGSIIWAPFGAKIDAPTVIASNEAASGKVKLTWEAVDGAAQYKVYRCESKTGEYKLMKTTAGTSYTNTSSAAGERYYYYVVAETSYGLRSNSSNIVNRTCDLPRPVVTASNVASSGKIQLTWKKIDGAVEYKVYRATSKTGEYKLMKTTTETSYTNTSAVVGKTYYYKVVAVHSNSAANSTYSEIKSRTCDLPRTVVTASNVASSGKIKLTWKKIDGAAQYKVYRATSKTGEYTLMKTTTETSYTNTSAVAGKAYYYKVVAVHANSAANSTYSEVKSRTCDLARPVVSISLNTSGKPVISWKAISGAEKYTVYMYDASGKLLKPASSSGTKLTHSSATKGNTYTYKVVAVHSNTSANSAKSSGVSMKSK